MIAYVPLVSPDTRVRVPVNPLVSINPVEEKVNDGSLSPTFFAARFAVTVTGLFVIVRVRSTDGAGK